MRQQGFTIVELMITVALIAVIAGIGIPSFRQLIATNRVTATINEFHSGLRLARVEAVKRNANVVFCATSNQTSCGGSWNDGWLIYHDADGDGVVDPDEVIRVGGGVHDGYNLTFSGGATAITFIARGLTSGTSGTFKLCDAGNDAGLARGIILLTTGSTRRAVDMNSNGIKEDESGADFSC